MCRSPFRLHRMRTETLVIGAGQAALAASYHLSLGVGDEAWLVVERPVGEAAARMPA
jgi:cation diffusion facilitator CzcD-associated flavoprotein CzcO